jgi:hypothetical protein
MFADLQPDKGDEGRWAFERVVWPGGSGETGKEGFDANSAAISVYEALAEQDCSKISFICGSIIKKRKKNKQTNKQT